MMVALTTRQRDLLQILLNSDRSLRSAEIAMQMQLTPRQVNYGLKGLSGWLARREVALKVTPGVGVELSCSPHQAHKLLQELDAKSNFQLVLTVEQRRQLIALFLLVANEPLILYQLQQLTQVSRTTILKDLDALQGWFEEHGLTLERRPNYGIWPNGPEQARRQALAAWLFGESPSGQPLTAMTHTEGLVFTLSSDAGLLPIVREAEKNIRRWDTRRMLKHVAYAETQMGGRFTDDAVLYLSLTLAIQAVRVQQKQIISVGEETLTWLKSLSAWHTASQIARRLGWQQAVEWPEAEIASVAMVILAAPRNERWPGDLEIDDSFSELVDTLMLAIAGAYDLPDLAEDRILRDGIVTDIIPNCLRHRFKLWMPAPPPNTALSDKHSFEHRLAHTLSATIGEHTGVTLVNGELNNLKLLLRAAVIRNRLDPIEDVWVVCPSGMATAQLLIVRLQARFPRLGTLNVVSMRELNQKRASSAQLIITTVPLPETITGGTKVIQVHPMLLPEDVEAITRWLT